MRLLVFLLVFAGFSSSLFSQQVTHYDLEYIVSPSIPSPQKETLEKVIVEEIGKRTGFHCKPLQGWVKSHPSVVVVIKGDQQIQGREIPPIVQDNFGKLMHEGYSIISEDNPGQEIIWIAGADPRGALFGIGKLLRMAEMSKGKILLPEQIDILANPEYSLRGHQLGYRNAANSWDKWTPQQYDQYIRELAIFGTNSIEDIPFQDNDQSPQMVMPHTEMHREISQICNNYDLDYWVWIPATGDLSDENIRKAEMKQHEAFYKSIPRLDGIFFPGGDPGDNHPKYVMPHLKDLAALLHKYHPNAGVWISLQGFDQEKVAYFFNYLQENSPDWLKGVVYGPSSPPVDLERQLLPGKYKHRLYGDITHTVRCQYPVENWDQAYALTLGREAPNPQPYYYARIFREDAPFTDGFLSYSDGVNDDVNKIIWSQMGWDSNQEIRDIMVEYGRFFFGPEVAEQAADGILALEQNWIGPLIPNGSVKATLNFWKDLNKTNLQLGDNWRWQMCLLRAYYDDYTRARLIYEKSLERKAYMLLKNMKTIGADEAMDRAIEVLELAVTNPVLPEQKVIIEYLADQLFKSIGLQSSVPKYQASGFERGCFMDFIDYPLNNRWWLEDEFSKVRKMANEQEKLARLDLIIHWENPGEGGYYDNISDVSASPHVISKTEDAIDYAWWDNGKSRKRLSTQLFQFSPELEYSRLDPDTDYLIRIAGYGEALLRANGVRLEPTTYDKELETFKEFPLPKELIREGKLKLTFDRPDESHLNWRQYSKVTDVWMIKR